MIAKGSAPTTVPVAAATNRPAEAENSAAPAIADPAVPTELTADATPPSSGQGGRGWVILLLLAAVAGAGWFFRDRWLPQLTPYLQAKQTGKAPLRVIPVGTAPVQQRDLEL